MIWRRAMKEQYIGRRSQPI